MTRGRKIAAFAGLGILGLLVVILITAFVVAQTDWFRNYVREKIIAVTEESTGGRVDIAAFDFDWSHLRATIDGFILHGTEKPPAAPLFQARRLTVELKLFSTLKEKIDLQALVVDTPQANLIVFPDGSTNVPSPKTKKTSDKSALETVVDLAVKRFELNGGSFTFDEQSLPLDARGQNLHAQLFFNAIARSYEGRLALDPLLVGYAGHPPLIIHVELPVRLDKDRVTLTDGRITTPKSELTVSGALENMNAPRTSARVKARLSVLELAQTAGLKIANSPSELNADISVAMSGDRIEISGARVDLGHSHVEASGELQGGALKLNASIAAGELGRLFQVSSVPEGPVVISATARTSKNFEDITVAPLNLGAFGGGFDGSASLKELRQLALNGDLRNFDIRALSRVFSGRPIGYAGVISGPVHVTADLKKPGTSGVQAGVQLAIAPGTHGVPVSGRLVAGYSGAADAIDVAQSYLALPHTRLDVSGTLDKQLNIKLATRDLNDFKPAAPDLPVALNHGSADFDGRVTGSLTAPELSGHMSATNFLVEGRAFDRFSADVSASPSAASIANAVLSRGSMQAQFAGRAGLRQWKPEPRQSLAATAEIHNADIADLLALAGEKDIQATGTLNASAKIGGTIGNPHGDATLSAVKGNLYDQPYDRLQAQVNLADELVTIPSASLVAGASRLDLDASFRHPREGFNSGHLEAHVKSNDIQIAQFQQLLKQTPGISGVAFTDLRVTSDLTEANSQSQFLLTGVNGDLSVRNLKAEGEPYGDFTANLRTANSTLTYQLSSNLAGSTIRVNGATQLIRDYPTNASATIANLPVERILALAGKHEIPARGVLAGNANFSGTMASASGSADLSLTKAVLYEEPVDSIHGRLNVTPQSIDLTAFDARAGPSSLTIRASYQHPAGDFMNGALRFDLGDSTLDLAQLRNVQEARPGLAGSVRLSASVEAKIVKAKDGEQVELTSLNADASTAALALNRTQLGNAKLYARTDGDHVTFNLDSDLAGSKISGKGDAALKGDYPMNAELRFANVTYSGLRPLLNASGPAPVFEVLADGQVNVSGPARRLEDLKGRLEITRFDAHSTGRPTQGNTPVGIRNEGNVVVSVDRSIIRVESAHLTGPKTNINIAGTAPLQGSTPIDLRVTADTNLNLLQQMSRDVYSDGAIALNATVRGTLEKPAINGRMELKNASLNLVDVPNGLSNANGVIIFNGTNADIQSLTAESGGGKINLGGFVGFAGETISYGLKANADGVRVRYPEGASVSAGANLNLTGTSERSVLGGTVTIQQIGYSPHSDFGSMLSSTATPAQVPAAPSGILAGMRLDIRVRTAPGLAVQTALAQNIQADADLHVRGTAANPGMTGRVNISEGELNFFGTKYTVNQGTISFYDPFSIRPILNIGLETVAKGVEVTLTVAGPIDNMKLTYHSDPPLQFEELVSLLATGKTPTSDPTILANQPTAPSQSFQQMGESAIVSQAIANPISSRLQRVFGVNQLKIDPTFTSGSELPQARLTLQQQVTNNLTFTYITNLTQANSQIVRIEWAFSNRWSAIANRDENGIVGVDLFYKRKFR